ncbi:unnamed protein product [Mycena citricolor]|uniref:RanBP2-type domain-containing protein n=1 Tax=Mycena citricolor TaxID=2018698 RepID=A0AAD2HGR1_9AGAR|nr:unnamed protein product [Mycena citricolor]
MSGAVRSKTRRSTVRSAASLPYARPKQQPIVKKSAWSIATGILGFFNPLRSRTASPSEESEDEDTDESVDGNSIGNEQPALNLSLRGRQVSFDTGPRNGCFGTPSPAAAAPASFPAAQLQNYSLPNASPTSGQSMESISTYLEQRNGQPITPHLTQGLISLIQSTPVEKNEPFRFSSNSGLLTSSLRGNSPITPTNDIFGLASTSTLPTTSSTKTLSRNPNGSYRWSGSGSARPSKNRYASPAFAAPSRSTSPHIVFRDMPSSTVQASPKRRRLETPPSTPPAVPRSAAPAPSPTRTSQLPFPLASPDPTPSQSSKNPHSLVPITPSRASIVPKSMPVHPSPLRQTWAISPTPSISSTGSSPTQSGTPTKAATLLTAIIKDADAEIPKHHPAVQNPYENPAVTRRTNTHRPAEPRRRTRATARATQKEREKEKEKEVAKEDDKPKDIPPEAIIQATLPKGSKRVRAPQVNGGASLSSLSAPTPVASRTDAEDEPSAKRLRMPPPPPVVVAPTPPPPVVEKPRTSSFISFADAPPLEDESQGSVSNPTFSLNGSAKRSKAGQSQPFSKPPVPLANSVKEPSKLRFSFAAESPSPADSVFAPFQPKEQAKPVGPTNLLSNVQVPSKPAPPPSNGSLPQAVLPTKDPKAVALDLPTTALPTFSFELTMIAPNNVACDSDARAVASSFSEIALPKFEFKVPSQPAVKAKEQAAAPVGFNWAAAGAKPPTKPVGWECKECTLITKDVDAAECENCGHPRITRAAPKVVGFDWSAAGKQPPPAVKAGSWTCTTCGLQNGPEVVDECSICQTVRK